jgi:hypothetical protein
MREKAALTGPEHSDRAEAGPFRKRCAERDGATSNSTKVSDISSCSYTQKLLSTRHELAARQPGAAGSAAGVAIATTVGAHDRGEQLRREREWIPTTWGASRNGHAGV